MVDRAEGELTAALEIALVRELRAAWRQVNEAYFRSRLTAPTLELVATRQTLGRWVPNTRTIEISRRLVIEQPWSTVIEVLKHEVAHQYVHEILGESGQTPHGRAFRASGMPATTGAEDDKVVDRIARLLALADSPNRHEAEAAMAAAQRLMLKYNLDAERARSAATYGYAHLGTPTGRIREDERLVAMILGKHFFVEAIWIPVYRPIEGKRASVLEICGTRANLAIAEYVHGFLHATAGRLWLEHKATRRTSDHDRRTYLAGVMVGFADTLARQDAKSRSEGLIWIKDGDLVGYFRRRHPYVRHVRHTGQRRTEAWALGRKAGQTIVLHRPVQATATSRGRLLPGKT
jgi:Protein of unknown function (DUF2786)/SprT-like family